jgi:carbonic anhydrase
MAQSAALPQPLREGYARFRTGRYVTDSRRYRQLALGGQRPTTLLVACSDSRSAPEAVFDAGPGQLFVVRNVAGLVPVYAPDSAAHGASAALEYGVLALEVGSIVVMGHGRCGGLAAALDDGGPLSSTDFLGTWVAGLRDLAEDPEVAGAADPEARRLALEHRSIERSLENLRTFPWVRAREGTGELRVHGAWFDIGLGELHELVDGLWRRVDIDP